MNDPNEVRVAWSYVEAFKVSGALTPSERDEWQTIIGTMSREQFAACREAARRRPMDRTRFRPTPDEWWAFLEAATPPKPANPAHVPYEGPEYAREHRSESANATGLEWLAKCREILAPPKKEVSA